MAWGSTSSSPMSTPREAATPRRNAHVAPSIAAGGGSRHSCRPPGTATCARLCSERRASTSRSTSSATRRSVRRLSGDVEAGAVDYPMVLVQMSMWRGKPKANSNHLLHCPLARGKIANVSFFSCQLTCLDDKCDGSAMYRRKIRGLCF